MTTTLVSVSLPHLLLRFRFSGFLRLVSSAVQPDFLVLCVSTATSPGQLAFMERFMINANLYSLPRHLSMDALEDRPRRTSTLAHLSASFGLGLLNDSS